MLWVAAEGFSSRGNERQLKSDSQSERNPHDGSSSRGRTGARLASTNSMRRMTFTTSIALIAACVALAALAAASLRAGDIVLHNHSPSMPQGLYLRTDAHPARGRVVTVRAMDVAPEAAHARRFDEAGDRFLKRVAGLHGDLVCAQGRDVSLNVERLAPRLATDATGGALETWNGCRRLEASELFLLGDSADSFDGRYWGPVEMSDIEGVWEKLGD